ncbi:MAG: lysine exporter LysO family protein [Tannerellaceae bacterium]|nr:lysine exporter LysO family protein [Tannerellaceae bacterium]
MFIVISCMLIGILSGIAGRKSPAIPLVKHTLTYTIWLLLFVLGTAIGSDRNIISNFPTLGGQAFILAFAGVTGSLLFAWLVYTLFFKTKQ